MENKQPPNLKSLQQEIIFIILHVSFHVAVMLLYIFTPGPGWDSSLHLLECETPVAEENRNEKWQNFRKALIFCSKMPCVRFTCIGQRKSDGLMWGQEYLNVKEGWRGRGGG